MSMALETPTVMATKAAMTTDAGGNAPLPHPKPDQMAHGSTQIEEVIRAAIA